MLGAQWTSRNTSACGAPQVVKLPLEQSLILVMELRDALCKVVHLSLFLIFMHTTRGRGPIVTPHDGAEQSREPDAAYTHQMPSSMLVRRNAVRMLAAPVRRPRV